MEKYLDLASRHGLEGEEALRFAAERLDKDQEREERRLEREKRAEEEREKRGKEREDREKERENRENERKHELEIERIRMEAIRDRRRSSEIANRTTAKRPKIPPFEDGKDDMGSYLSRF